jgi:hypothetical protein
MRQEGVLLERLGSPRDAEHVPAYPFITLLQIASPHPLPPSMPAAACSIVAAACVGQAACMVPAVNAIFDDPCPLVRKRLQFGYRWAPGCTGAQARVPALQPAWHRRHEERLLLPQVPASAGPVGRAPPRPAAIRCQPAAQRRQPPPHRNPGCLLATSPHPGLPAAQAAAADAAAPATLAPAQPQAAFAAPPASAQAGASAQRHGASQCPGVAAVGPQRRVLVLHRAHTRCQPGRLCG